MIHALNHGTDGYFVTICISHSSSGFWDYYYHFPGEENYSHEI